MIDIVTVCTDLLNDEGAAPLRAGRMTVYDDATGARIVPGSRVQGHPTIGYGRALDTNGISVLEAYDMLRTDVTNAFNYANTLYTWFQHISETRQRVVINMIFQLGVGGFSGFHELIHAILNADWQAAHDAMLASAWAKQAPARASRLAQWMLTDNAGIRPCQSQTSPLNGASVSPSPST